MTKKVTEIEKKLLTSTWRSVERIVKMQKLSALKLTWSVKRKRYMHASIHS